MIDRIFGTGFALFGVCSIYAKIPTIMLPDKIGPLTLLKALVGHSAGTDTKRIAQIFEMFLEKSRFGSSSPSELNSLSNRLQTAKLPAHKSEVFPPVPMKHLSRISQQAATPVKQSRQAQIETYQDNIPRAVPHLANLAAQKHGVPQALFRKMIWIESEFNPAAVSPRGAMGLGQLMPETARELGLRTDSDKGEGSVWHAESNLDAAARYMKWLHTQFTDKGVAREEAWRFSAAAYNAGIGNISRAMDRVTSGSPAHWEDVAQHLPEITGKYSKETLNYIERLRIDA